MPGKKESVTSEEISDDSEVMESDDAEQSSGDEIEEQNSGDEIEEQNSGNEIEEQNSGNDNIEQSSGGDNAEQSSGDDDESESENENAGNAGWADAMCRVLNTNVSRSKNFILSKAKKDTDAAKVKEKQEIEMVDESGNVIKVKKPEVEQVKSYKDKRKEMIEKQKQKAAWESMCRVKPDVTNKDRERELVRIATRGVVHLFNTVEKHQKSMKNPKEKNPKRKESLGVVKGTFMDILKGHSKKQLSSEADPVMKKVKHEETWNILKDDFMMGADMKDWDSDNNE